MKVVCSVWILLFFLGGCVSEVEEVSIDRRLFSENTEFGFLTLAKSLEKQGKKIRWTHSQKESDIFFSIEENSVLTSEGFRIERSQNQLKVVAKDSAGLLYGQLELAEQIQLYNLDSINEVTKNPYMEMRGIKLNIPLDARTPSYSDASDVAQHNIPVMWDINFWKSFIDQLATYRYNFISLWNLQPFPSIVKTPGYENIALDNVHRSTHQWEEYYHLHGTGLTTPEILDSPEVVNKMSIEEKITFWNQVMAYGKSRNIDFYWVTWNIFTDGIFGKYGITNDIDNPQTKDYFKQSVKAVFKTYPDLQGIGLTTGENMPNASFEEKENWAFDTYAQGLLEVAEEMPNRRFTLIHRQHQTGAPEIIKKFAPAIKAKNVEFLFSFKYAKAHVFSAIEQPYHQKFVEETKGVKTLWMLRNDDAYYFRWGAPDFVRSFIKNIPHSASRGIYYGSDQWIWGRDFLTKNTATRGQLEIKKHWYHWLLWGRLSYDPDLSNARCKDLIKNRFSEVDADRLFNAWHHASMIYPITTGFHWGRYDFQWYIEACKSRPKQAENTSGFHDVNRFISLGTHPKSGYQSIPEYVSMQQNKKLTELKTPLQVADDLSQHASKALQSAESMLKIDISDPELIYTLKDIVAVAYLGSYYSHKIRGATYLALYDADTGNSSLQEKAIQELTNALSFWSQYVKTAKSSYKNPIWTNRVGYVDWDALTEWVQNDINIAKNQ